MSDSSDRLIPILAKECRAPRRARLVLVEYLLTFAPAFIACWRVRGMSACAGRVGACLCVGWGALACAGGGSGGSGMW